jgi:hypothetical protein
MLCHPSRHAVTNSEARLRNPLQVSNRYCPDPSTGVACPIGVGVSLSRTAERVEQV